LRRARLRCAGQMAMLVHFHDSRGLHDRRLLLAIGKPRGSLAVNVDAGEFLAVVVIHGHLPVTVFPPTVAVHAIGPFALRGLFGLLFFHVAVP
jgi:hypothetical protein